ncbi:class I adenylate-forming enzyme family protein [Thauera sinica]|uniref:Class I adenylate-forming enzyme family protein n=1 Tax=Thauera sinica TaxID=2665146 RepID=A0ABW1AYR3_9RHOO|nr:class I adenylate-forming enzyme family protein [Thauera sp. K11]ATE62405.1 acyl-CoA synthetase [Thauera sp. K11]
MTPPRLSLPARDLPLDGVFETFADVMEAAAARFPACEAYVQGARRLSFSDWYRDADGLAGALQAHGVRQGDVVLIALDSSIEFATACAGALLLGAVASGVNTRLGPQEIGGIIAGSGAKALIAEDSAAVPADVPLVIRRAALPELCRQPPLGRRRPRVRGSDPAIIVWTSGTTGQPKGAWFDHRNLEAAIFTAGPMAAPFDRRLVSTPFAHAGYMTKLWEQLAFVMTNVISPASWNARDMLRLIAEEKITWVGAVPTQWAKLMALPEVREADFSTLRIAASATAPMPADLAERVTRTLGCPLIVRYASTESPSMTGTVPGDDPETLFHTVGLPQLGVELRIVDDRGVPVADGDIGVVQVRSPVVMRGYWRDEEATRAVLAPDGWFSSGDLGRFDDDGNLVLVGRRDDMYIRGGYNVYPTEVERVLAEHPDVGQVVIVGMPAPVIGEIGVAFVVPADRSRPPSLDALRAWCRERLADYKTPDRLEIVEALPLTAMMKIDKRALRAVVGVESGSGVTLQ